jgi:hypothetical protein
MKRIVPAAIVAALVSTAATIASAEAAPAPCCACVPKSGGQTSGNGDGPAVHAFFCSLGITEEVENRCGGHTPPRMLLCVPGSSGASTQGDSVPGASCTEQLAAEGIICPAAGVPTAAPLGVGLLALVLTGLGTATLRRRSRRPRA